MEESLMTCLFCSIASGDIPADVVMETDEILAFRDIDPKAPSHVLVIPRAHFDNVATLTRDNPELAANLLQATAEVAMLETLENGYRVVTNTGSDGGQSVHHVHFHVLGGRQLEWPPG
jgi:histidine triad (HIT) family protein